MGSWQLEVAKMFFYIMFPVFAFHMFNQPDIFNNWMLREKDKMDSLIPRINHEKFKLIKEQFFKNFEEEKQNLIKN